jgi:hypothetical protein
MDGCQTVSFSKQRQAFQYLFWAMVQFIKYGPFISHKNTAAYFAFQTLCALGSTTLSHDVSMIHFAAAYTPFIPTKRTCES